MRLWRRSARLSRLLRIRARHGLRSVLWCCYAQVYDELLHLAPYQHLLTMVAERSALPTGGVICEVGCGTGNLVARMAAGSTARVVGIEPSAEMIRRARSKLKDDSRVALLQADAITGLRSIATGTIRAVVLCNVAYAITDRRALWHEAARVLTPEGRIVLCHSDRGGSRPIVLEHVRTGSWRAFLRPGLYEVAGIDALISFLASRGEFAFTSFEQLQSELRTAGLTLEFETRCYGGETSGVNFLATAHR